MTTKNEIKEAIREAQAEEREYRRNRRWVVDGIEFTFGMCLVAGIFARLGPAMFSGIGWIFALGGLVGAFFAVRGFVGQGRGIAVSLLIALGVALAAYFLPVLFIHISP